MSYAAIHFFGVALTAWGMAETYDDMGDFMREDGITPNQLFGVCLLMLTVWPITLLMMTADLLAGWDE